MRTKILLVIFFYFALSHFYATEHLTRDRMSYRAEHGVVETATVVFEHSVSHKKVTFIGMYHIGDKAFYEKLNTELLASSKTSRIYFEGITDEKPREPLTSLERSIVEKLRYVANDYLEERATFNRIALQAVTLRIPKGGVVNDMTYEAFARACARKFGCATWAQVHATKWAPLVYYVAPWIPLSFDRTLVEDRNDVALAPLLRTDSPKESVLVWGAAHFPDIHDKLEAAGYREMSKVWRRVCSSCT